MANKYDDSMDLNEGEEFYMDEFGERIHGGDDLMASEEDELFIDDNLNANDMNQIDEEDTLAADRHAEDFHESLGDSSDQLEDEGLQQEAESDYGTTSSKSDSPQDESLMDKAKHKLDEMTGHDHK